MDKLANDRSWAPSAFSYKPRRPLPETAAAPLLLFLFFHTGGRDWRGREGDTRFLPLFFIGKKAVNHLGTGAHIAHAHLRRVFSSFRSRVTQNKSKMAALTCASVTVVAAKAQRVGGVAAKKNIARVGGLKAKAGVKAALGTFFFSFFTPRWIYAGIPLTQGGFANRATRA